MLPDNPKQAWPPEQWQAQYSEYALRSAWYGADVEALANLYYKQTKNPNDRQSNFDAALTRKERRSLIHMPICGDIASVAANLLFSEPPQFTAVEESAQDRLTEIVTEGNINAKLLEAADSASGLGGVFFKIAWDKALSPVPLACVVQADAAIPEFKFGILTACTFWMVLETDNQTVWRLLERHEPGLILTGLYCGSPEELGSRIALVNRADTAPIQEVVQTQLEGLACWYVPNARPNRRNRASDLGQADTAGAETLLESLDEAYTSWLRDLSLGKARAFIPEGLMQWSDGKPYFGQDQEYYRLVNSPGTNESLGNQIVTTQAAIRFAEHEGTCLNWLERIISHAQYAPQSFGLHIEGRAESGTALKIRERASFVTTAQKAAYWKPVLSDLLEAMLTIDSKHLGGGKQSAVNVKIEDSVSDDIHQLAPTLNMLRQAQAASTERLVRMSDPNMPDDDVAKEVQRITDETGLAVPSPETLGDDA